MLSRRRKIGPPTLPKRLRRKLAPVPDHVREVMPILLASAIYRKKPLQDAVADSLNQQVRVGHARMSGVLGAAAMAAPSMEWADTVWDAARAINGRDGPVYDPDPARVTMINDRYARLREMREGLVKSYRKGGLSP